jgi:hypothetical protein
MSTFVATSSRSRAGQATVGGAGNDHPRRHGGDGRKPPNDKPLVPSTPMSSKKSKVTKKKSKKSKESKKKSKKDSSSSSSSSSSCSDDDDEIGTPETPSKKGTDRRPACLKFLNQTVPQLDTMQWNRRTVVDVVGVLRDWDLHQGNSLASRLELIGPIDTGAEQVLGWRTPESH